MQQVDAVLGILKLDHQPNVLEVHASASQVCRHETDDLVSFELEDRICSFAVGQLRVEAVGEDALRAQVFRQFDCRASVVAEDDRFLRHVSLKQLLREDKPVFFRQSAHVEIFMLYLLVQVEKAVALDDVDVCKVVLQKLFGRDAEHLLEHARAGEDELVMTLDYFPLQNEVGQLGSPSVGAEIQEQVLKALEILLICQHLVELVQHDELGSGRDGVLGRLGFDQNVELGRSGDQDVCLRPVDEAGEVLL